MPIPLNDTAELDSWLRLAQLPGFDANRSMAAVAHLGSARDLLRCDPEALGSLGFGKRARDALATARDLDVADACRWLEHPGHHLVLCTDERYPSMLLDEPSAPVALFFSGDPELAWHPQIAVIGSRNPTQGGLELAADFAATLSRSGLVVTSGLAAGIDAAAHRATIEAGGRTIAVLGTGPDLVYPRQNAALAERIVSGTGALLSEFLPGTPARREHFPQRNRIIAALGLGTLVIEASLASGSLITARLANERGREVFAIPGSIHNPMARGCHRLIRDGAKLVETAQEVIDELAPLAGRLGASLRSRLEAPVAASNPQRDEDPDYARVFAALGFDPVSLDELAGRTGLTVAQLSSMLLIMELDGRVSAGAGGRYSRSGARQATPTQAQGLWSAEP